MEEDINELEKIVELRKEKCKGKIEYDSCIVKTRYVANLIARYKELEDLQDYYIDKIKELEQENHFLKMMYRGTEEFKNIEKLANSQEV